jgi:hypothetical protein
MINIVVVVLKVIVGVIWVAGHTDLLVSPPDRGKCPNQAAEMSGNARHTSAVVCHQLEVCVLAALKKAKSCSTWFRA